MMKAENKIKFHYYYYNTLLILLPIKCCTVIVIVLLLIIIMQKFILFRDIIYIKYSNIYLMKAVGSILLIQIMIIVLKYERVWTFTIKFLCGVLFIYI